MKEFEPHFLLTVGRENNTDTMELKVEVREDCYSDEINIMTALKKKLMDHSIAWQFGRISLCRCSSYGRIIIDHNKWHGGRFYF